MWILGLKGLIDQVLGQVFDAGKKTLTYGEMSLDSSLPLAYQHLSCFVKHFFIHFINALPLFSVTSGAYKETGFQRNICGAVYTSK